MSISEIPPVKITFTTPQDISDEILGGTLSFCKEIGYKPNIIMLTYFWAGLLLSLKDQLYEHNLTEKVLACYTRSLGCLFPKITEDGKTIEQVQDMLQLYWTNLSRDFELLNTEAEVSAFLQIASELNNQDSIASSYLLNKDPQKPFLKISSAIHSSIHRILHQIDNGFGIEYRGILGQIRISNNHQQVATARTENNPPKQSPQKAATTSQPREAISIPWRKIIVWGLVIIAILFVIIHENAPDRTESISSSQQSTLVAVQEPQSGTVLFGTEKFNESELTITASSSESCVVKLKTSSGTTRLSFYVRAGDTVTVGVPAEHLYVYFASGQTWYGEDHLFGDSTSYSKDDQLLDFKQYSWEYTLYPVSYGNFSETPIDPEDF